ncbi:redoxin domain-containing protein [Flavobacteriaceae bacterium R38]|nr:redoxin domain-containing protein [Flavobacteriaceae bacterium R38]
MKKNKRLISNILIILVVLAFFVTPLGYESKIILNRILSFSPDVVKEEDRIPVADFDWKLKDENWDFFNFENAKGKVIFVHFWASWRVPSVAEAKGIQKLYDKYKDDVVFYIITNEDKAPVEEFMQKRGYNFPVTYLIIGEKMPFDAEKIPSTYIIDKEGYIAIEKEGIANWYSKDVRELLDTLIEN